MQLPRAVLQQRILKHYKMIFARSKEILDRIPQGRWGTPEDFGGLIVFLASSASDYVKVEFSWLTADGRSDE